MTFSNSMIRAPHHHLEQIAHNLLQKRRASDYSTCDLRIELKNGYELVHSIVVCAHSRTLDMMLEKKRAPYSPIDMMQFEFESFRRVIDWMYSGEIDSSGAYLRDDVTVASYLKVGALQSHLEQQIKAYGNENDIVMAINMAATSTVTDDTMNTLVVSLSNSLSKLSGKSIAQLELNSIIAIMSSLLPLEKKVPLINMAILWIQMTKPSRDSIVLISQSVVISDMIYECIYTLRQSLQQYLVRPQLAAKSNLQVSPSGQINLKIYTRQAQPIQRTRSDLSMIEALPDPFVKSEKKMCSQRRMQLMRTQSEMEFMNGLADPFEKKSSVVQLKRETNGFPKLFTQSSVDRLRAMDDPFLKTEKSSSENDFSEEAKKIPPKLSASKNKGFNQPTKTKSQKAFNLMHSASEMDVIRAMPDPFSPVIMTPKGCVTVAEATSSTCSLKNRVTMPSNYRADFLVSSRSGTKTATPARLSATRSPSEIAEIGGLPSISAQTIPQRPLSTRASKKNMSNSGKW